MSETGWRQSILRRIASGVESLAEAHPRGYLLLATALTLAGYGWLLLFPWLVVAGVAGGYEALTGEPAIAWDRLLIWSAVAAGGSVVTYRIARFRPVLPAGIMLNRRKAPALFDLLGEMGRHYPRPSIDRVVITGAFAVDLVKTPRRALPVWSVNTLLIGLPLMQSLSPGQFRCMLARRLGQFSKRHNPLSNWLSQLRRIWPQYAIAPAAAVPGFQPVRWFFSVFAPLYERVSLPAARLDELAADGYAMEVCCDEEVLDAITTEAVCRVYIEEKYWPVYRRLSATARKAMPKPHAGMVSVLRAGLQGERAKQWLDQAMDREPSWNEPLPSLASRVANLGFLKPRMGELASVSTAVAYLGSTAEELDKALGWRPTRENLQKRGSHALKPGPSTRLARRSAPGAANHLQIPSP